jgi:UDP-3-O-[3-hydroxymyristoyl] glucosamine N-acyltransferase
MSFIDPTVVLGKGVYVDAFVCIAKNAKIGDHVELQAHTYIGESVQIGKRSKLYSGVKIMHQVQIGEDCIIHANAVIGSDGFGFAPQEDGTYVKVPQLGNVILEDRVEVGAQTVVDRATMGSTLIQSGVKLDNLIQIAHNVVVGKNTVIAAQSGIAGSTKIGENCMIGGQVGIVGHIEIAKGTKIQAQSGINKSIKKENEAFFGSPALLYNDFLKSNAVFKQLPELLKRLDSLEKKLKDL